MAGRPVSAHLACAIAGRPPPAPGLPSTGFSQGWTTSAAKTTCWRRSQSASALRNQQGNGKTRLDASPDSGSNSVPSTANGYQGVQSSERLRSAGAEVVGTPPRKPSHDSTDHGRSSPEQDVEPDVHVDCRARIQTLLSELAEASQAAKAAQREQERVLIKMGNERQDFRVLQKTHSESEQVLLRTNTELHRCRAEHEEHEQRATRFRPWETSEEQTVVNLQLSLQTSEAREHQFQSALAAEKSSAQVAAQQLEDALRGERALKESLAGTQEKELRLAKLQNDFYALEATCITQDEATASLQARFAESRACQDVLRQEVSQHKEVVAAELKAALEEMQASEHQCTDTKNVELTAERDEARRQATLIRTGEAAARTLVKITEKRLSVSEMARSESQAAMQMREKEMQDIQVKTTKTATKKEAEVRMLQSQLEQSKTEIAELYDALVRAGENTQRSSSKRKTAKG